jgi:hypothetical protein
MGGGDDSMSDPNMLACWCCAADDSFFVPSGCENRGINSGLPISSRFGRGPILVLWTKNDSTLGESNECVARARAKSFTW